jgi:hypothetical protein
MTESELADLLRRLDDDAPLDDLDLAFKARLRDDLDDTLGRDGTNRARLVGDGTRRTPRRRHPALVAAVLAMAIGAAVIVASRSSEPSTGPVATQPPAPTSTTTLPTLDPGPACDRFLTSEANELLTAPLTDDLTAARIDIAVEDLSVLITDVGAATTDDQVSTLLGRVRDAVGEAGLRLEAGDRVGAAAALENARVDFSAIGGDGPFRTCFGP